jgi:hypothetical protein
VEDSAVTSFGYVHERKKDMHGKHIILGFENYDLVKIKTSKQNLLSW